MTTKPDLKPRAIAVLVALRNGPLATRQLRAAIADVSTDATRDLLGDMRYDLQLVDQQPGGDRWYLTHDGLGWLERHGLTADISALLPAAKERAS